MPGLFVLPAAEDGADSGRMSGGSVLAPVTGQLPGCAGSTTQSVGDDLASGLLL